jgi:cation:H+ antiporter
MMAFSILLVICLLAFNGLSRWVGALFTILLILFIILLIRYTRRYPEAVDVDESIKVSGWPKILLLLLLGGGALWGGSELLVSGAIGIATSLGIPESVVAVSMVAVGTSVPELAASVIAAVRKEKAISLGNLIGSNIFNIGSVLGLTALIEPISISSNNQLITSDIWWMLGIAFLLLPLAFIQPRYLLNRWKSAIILATYAAFILCLIYTL